MPTLADLQSRFATPRTISDVHNDSLEEALVCDSRASMRPAQVVEQKLRSALQRRGAFAAPTDGFKPKPR